MLVILVTGMAGRFERATPFPPHVLAISQDLPRPDSSVELERARPDNGPPFDERDPDKCRIGDGKVLGRAVTHWWNKGVYKHRFDMQRGTAVIIKDGSKVILAVGDTTAPTKNFRMLMLEMSEAQFLRFWQAKGFVEVGKGSAVARIRAIMNYHSSDLKTTTRARIDAKARWSTRCSY